MGAGEMRRPALALLLGCLLLVAGASALDGYDYYQTIEYAGCDQSVYQQDIVIHRSTGTAYNETSGGLETWHIYVGDHCLEDYGDIRFTNSTGAELAYYLWPDYSSESARFAVRLEGADAAGEVTVWYGDSSATTTSDGDRTYLLFDHFDEAAINTSLWTPYGSPTVSESAVSIDGSQDSILSLQTFGVNTAVEGHGTLAAAAYHIFGYENGRAGVPLITYQFGYPTGGVYNARIHATSTKTVNLGSGYGAAPHTWQIWRNSTTNAEYYIDGALVATHSSQLPAGSIPILFHRDGSGAGVSTFDYILVRTRTTTPPAALTFSGEQSLAAPPVTAFTANTTAGLAPLTVQFTDLSTGGPTSWLWTFGDGNTSTAQNPQHTYTAPGLYTVTLNATNEYGSDEEIKTNYITVYGPVTAQFSANITGGTAPLTVQFTDFSTGGPTSWLWSFGDGNTSTAQNPQHTYTTAGTHTVTLTASHPYDSDTETKTAYITVAVLQPFPGLTLIPRDLTGNGLYTDINGNNRLDYNDLTVFFLNLAWARDNEPTECFDFNQNGRLDYADVIALFQVIKNA